MAGPDKDELTTEDYRAALERLDRFARVTDSCFRIPFTGIRFGVSPLIGLLPVIGDFAGLLLSFYVISEAQRMRAPRLLRLRMIWNAGVEAVVGIVPFLGDAFDVWFKANTRNLDLLCGYLHVQLEPPEPRRNWPWLIAVVFAMGLFVVLLTLGYQSAGTGGG